MTSSRPRILAVGFDKQNRGILQRTAHALGCKITTVSTISGAMYLLAGNQAPAIFCEHELPDGSWRDLLDCTPKLIVVSRRADEPVLADVLNRGGFDVLASPLEERAVLHALGSVCRDERRLAAPSEEMASAAAR